MDFPPPTPRQARILWCALTALAVGVVLALAGLLCWGAAWLVGRLSSVLLPLAVAGILAYLLDPLVGIFQEKLSIPRMRSILLVFFLAVMLVLILLATVVPRLIVETNALIRRLPDHVETLRDKLDRFMQGAPLGVRVDELWNLAAHRTNASVVTNLPAGTLTNAVPPRSPRQTPAATWQTDLSRRAVAWMADVLPRIGQWFLEQLSRVASWAGLVAGFALVPVYLFYFLLEKRGIQSHWTNYLPIQESKLKEEVVFVLTAINDCLIVFFRGQVLVALCSGTLLTVGFLALGLRYAVLIGALAGLLGIVPYLGVMLSIVPAVILAILQFGDWWHPLLVVLIFALVQSLEGLVISPRIIGGRVGLHPLTVIIAVMTGTTLLGGILGGVLAIPLTAALRTLMFRYVWKKTPASSPVPEDASSRVLP
jgi:predicted PurR-regulated permease PerM